jgi:glycosyltransferase involved in cell wall biosynthesis
MRISIIIACLDPGPLLPRCLESVARQTHPDIEIVVADGGSRDGTAGLLRRWRPPTGVELTFFSAPDGGIADAWNRAITRAGGEWILFLGADDVLAEPTVIANAAAFLADADPRCRVVYGEVVLVDREGMEVARLARPWSAREFRGCRYNLPHQAVFHHHSLLAEFGPFDTSLSISADFDLLLRALARDEPTYVPGLTVTRMQVGGLSSSRRNAPLVVMEELRLFRRYGAGMPWVLYWWLLKAVIKSGLHRFAGEARALAVTNLYRRVIRGEEPLRY